MQIKLHEMILNGWFRAARNIQARLVERSTDHHNIFESLALDYQLINIPI